MPLTAQRAGAVGAFGPRQSTAPASAWQGSVVAGVGAEAALDVALDDLVELLGDALAAQRQRPSRRR
jgi:hypothetical protein